ncbi:L-rhamnose catabolism isomerase [Aestuariibacter sp. GS-14]|uniref:L-rhamnose catabolism isomerase n=1 Tax=Aestuariibacter sp. GS-14 TaxID=2590670 RepID=UPI0011280D3D|nr:L-rhamnose catabolism isomerase [Aestuariibacter sp. GS-14]TPV59756.1 L-rhamnose catabolism isomerase [Aestuariibacter sp. GS-14]
MNKRIDSALLEAENAKRVSDLNSDYAALGDKLARADIDIEAITAKAGEFQIAVPSWGTGTGGTRFARFPGEGEPRNIFEKLEDCAVINELSGCTDSVSPHFPWDKVSDFSELKQQADAFGLKWVSVNSNTFQDQPGQVHSYKYGSLSNTQKASRDLAIQHNLDVIEYGQKLGAKSLTVWVGDGSNHPGQQHFQRAFERYLASMEEVYKGLPDDWEMHIEHKMFEPAFYSTVIQDWGSNLLAAMHLGPKCKSLVDLGHHAPNTNIEMIVSRLIQFKKLGGFHFNDSKYGDDDLDSGSLHPYQQFLIFNELVDAEYRKQEGFGPAYMLDQSHNVTDPAESLINSAIEVQRSYVKALLVNREALYDFQENNDALMASLELKNAFNLDVSPILAMARYRKGAAIEPLAVYRQAGYRKAMAVARPRDPNATGSGIV